MAGKTAAACACEVDAGAIKITVGGKTRVLREAQL